MCNRARLAGEPETLHARFSASWAQDVVRPNASLEELYPKSRAYTVREKHGRRVGEVMSWDVLGGEEPWPMTTVRNLKLPQWRSLATEPAQRCLIPLTEFCEWTPDEGKPVKGEMWFAVPEQLIFAVAGFWQFIAQETGFTMVACDPNELIAPIHPKAMITILHEADWDRWLQGSYGDVMELQQPFPADHMNVRGPVFPTRREGDA